MPVGRRLVVLYAHRTPGNSSTHFPLAESKRFLRAVKIVLFEASAWPLLCGYLGVEYRFFMFKPSQKSL